MSLTTLSLPHLPIDLLVHIALYTSIRNATYLRSQLIAGNPDYEYALIDAAMILSPTHLYAAIFRASNDFINERMKSRNLHSEIIFCLGTNNNIAQTLNSFGIAETTTDAIVVKIVCPSLGIHANLTDLQLKQGIMGRIDGEMIEWSNESSKRLCDVERVRRMYKLGKSGAKDSKSRRRKDGSLEGRRGESEINEETTPRTDGKEAPGRPQAKQEERTELEVQVLGLMALRGAV